MFIQYKRLTYILRGFADFSLIFLIQHFKLHLFKVLVVVSTPATRIWVQQDFLKLNGKYQKAV